VNFQSLAYTPFIRLALVRYQPFALPDAKLSPVALADFAQLTPERSAVFTADPYHPRRLRLTVSGPAPSGPAPVITGSKSTHPINVATQVTVTLQQRDPLVHTDLGWQDAPAGSGIIDQQSIIDPSGLVRWTGTVDFATLPQAGQFRVLVREYEYLSANYTNVTRVGRRIIEREQPKRLVYAEVLEVDTALIGGPTSDTGTQF
jgi:hypothetical protein